MTTQAEVTEQFTTELRALLARYNAEIEADDYPRGKICITVTIPSVWAGDNVEREFAEIRLGDYINAKE